MTTKESFESFELIYAEVVDDDAEVTLGELCRVCQVSAERVMELVDEGIVEPACREATGREAAGREAAQWRFRAVSIRRARSALRLQRDLGVNTAGAALALDLLEELETMRARLRRFEE